MSEGEGSKAARVGGVDWTQSYLERPGWGWVPSWLYPFLRPEMLAMLMLGFASGLPLYMFYSKTSIWLRAEGIERSTIGFFYWIGLAYTLKWIWAPVIDRATVPLLTKIFGHRRSWMMVSIAGTVIGLLLLSTASPADGLLRVLLGAGLIAFSGATLDVSIDAWRIESAPNEAQANMAASYSLGYRGALFFSGIGVFVAGKASWSVSFLVMALAMALCAALVSIISEPTRRKASKSIDNLPLFAGPWSAIAVGTAFFVFARALRWIGVDSRLFVSDQPIGEWIILCSFVLAIGSILTGRLIFRGTDSKLPIRILLAVLGSAYVFANEIVSFASGASAESPFFRLALVVFSLVACGIYSRMVFFAFESSKADVERTSAPRGKVYELFGVPFIQLWDRYGKIIIPIVILVLIYRTSDFTMGVMAGPLYIDLGYDEETIGLIQSFVGVIPVFVGLFLGGIVANQIGVMRSLVIGAVLTLITNGFYAYFAATATGNDPLFLGTAIFADNIAGGFVTTVFIAYLSSLVDPKFAATQYALFSSLYALLSKMLAGFSGLMADAMGYVMFFLITASYAIPAGILVLVIMSMQKRDAAAAEAT